MLWFEVVGLRRCRVWFPLHLFALVASANKFLDPSCGEGLLTSVLVKRGVIGCVGLGLESVGGVVVGAWLQVDRTGCRRVVVAIVVGNR